MADLKAQLLCKHVDGGCFFLIVRTDDCVRLALGHRRNARSSRVEKRAHLMPRGRSDAVSRITPLMVRLKSNFDIGHSCLTLICTLKLDSLFPLTLHLKFLSKLLMTRTIFCEIPYAMSVRHRLYHWMLSKAFSNPRT